MTELVPIETARLVLRPLCEEDAEDAVALARNEELAQMAGRPPATSSDAGVAHFRESLERQARGELFVWTLRRRDDRIFVGALSLRSVDRAPHALSLGCEMLPSFWGHGYMAEAVRAVVAHAFSAMGKHRIEAMTSPDNGPSQRVLERVGFVKEGILRGAHARDGQFSDNVVYSRLATDE